MKTAAHEFGALLDRIMDEHDLTQAQLADRLGYTQGWITQVRTGHKAPSFSMAGRIAQEFPEFNELDVYLLIKDARRIQADSPAATSVTSQMRGYHDSVAA